MASQGANQLFQVLYLGRTGVDRHCSLAVMPWIAEELKLKTEQRILTWLTPGVCRVGDRGRGKGERERERERVCVCESGGNT